LKHLVSKLALLILLVAMVTMILPVASHAQTPSPAPSSSPTGPDPTPPPDGGDAVTTFAAPQAVLYDDFADASMDPTKWTYFRAGTGATAAEDLNVLSVALGAPQAITDDPDAGAFAAGYESTCTLTGDFDIQLDFEAPNGDDETNVRAGFALVDFTGSVHRRFATAGQYAVHTASGISYGGFGSNAGSIRMVRVGTTLTGYFMTYTGWQTIGSQSVDVEGSRFRVQAWSHESEFVAPGGTPGGTQVDFDNVSWSEETICVVPAPTDTDDLVVPPDQTPDSPETFWDWYEDNYGSGPLGATEQQVFSALRDLKNQLGAEQYENFIEDNKVFFNSLYEDLLDPTGETVEQTVSQVYVGIPALSPEANVCASHPWSCFKARDAQRDAIVTASNRYPNVDGSNTIRDAFRHCLWSAFMTERANFDYALAMGNAHEERSTHPRATKMDLWNNSKGRLAGFDLEGRPDREMADRCELYADSGVLILSPDDPRADP
jgi:hypothetical protein